MLTDAKSSVPDQIQADIHPRSKGPPLNRSDRHRIRTIESVLLEKIRDSVQVGF